MAGLVTHRQRPSTAGGVTFLNLEDETGMLNVVCSRPMWQRFVRVGRRTNAMLVRGTIEHSDGVTNLVADQLEPLSGLFPAATAAAIPLELPVPGLPVRRSLSRVERATDVVGVRGRQ